jgi:DNA-binding MarR family transcriptional regulator
MASSRGQAADPKPEAVTGTLLLHAFQGFERTLFDRLARRGHKGLRRKHGAVLANVDAAGTRASVLAARAGMTPPAMGELVDELENKGYVQRVADPTDRRAKLVMPTAKTLARQRVVSEVVAGIEAEYCGLLGAAHYQVLRQALQTLVQATGSGSEVAQPRPPG